MKTTSQSILRTLQTYEPVNMLWVAKDGSWPIVWKRAQGMHVWDVENRKYLDLTAAFGVAAAGHGCKPVVQAGRRQMAELLHAMGDVHPHPLKAELSRTLSELTFERWSGGTLRGKTMYANSGFEAVEAALKTAMLATKRRGVIAFQGAYHGLGYGTLNATHRDYFRQPFLSQLGQFGEFVPLDIEEKKLETLLRTKKFGAILVEPIQGRGGVNVPDDAVLPMLRRVCDRHGALLIVDEIFTGFGRTGTWFACEHTETIPDLICLGKALTGGFPMSVCVGRAAVMDRAWPKSHGEAIHTSTFQGHPVGCAMALSQIATLTKQHLPARSAALGVFFREELRRLNVAKCLTEVRGRGLMLGWELRERSGKPATKRALHIVQQMLQRGFILLPEGEFGNVISFSPPLIITWPQIESTLAALREVIR